MLERLRNLINVNRHEESPFLPEPSAMMPLDVLKSGVIIEVPIAYAPVFTPVMVGDILTGKYGMEPFMSLAMVSAWAKRIAEGDDSIKGIENLSRNVEDLYAALMEQGALGEDL